MTINTQKPYICPNCGKAYPLPPKACSCENFETFEEIHYYFMPEKPLNLDEFSSVAGLDVKEITENEFMRPSRKGFYIEEIYSPGIETLGSFSRSIKKMN